MPYMCVVHDMRHEILIILACLLPELQECCSRSRWRTIAGKPTALPLRRACRQACVLRVISSAHMCSLLIACEIAQQNRT